MEAIWLTLESLDFMSAVWLFPVAVALHEFEQWNIVPWYRRHFHGLSALENRGLRAWIAFSSILAFVWAGLAVLPGNPTVAALVLFPAFVLMLQNALQHIYYLALFRSYVPGLLTSVVFLIPTISYLSARAVRHSYVPAVCLLALALLVIPNMIQTVKAGRHMLPSLYAVHRFGAALANRILGPGHGADL